MRSVEVLVIGAGASGMVAAIEAARMGRRVLILEKKNRIGKKLLVTGNGRCNFTNLLQSKECYRSDMPEKAWDIVQSFDEQQVIAWFQEIGVLAAQREGYIYPASMQATSMLHALARELERLHVEIHTEEPVINILEHPTKTQGTSGYQIVTSQGKYLANHVIMSMGGSAAPVHGSEGDGYRFAKMLGIAMNERVPALTSLILKEKLAKQWAGNRTQGKVSVVSAQGEVLASDQGELQFVAYGISGIPVFQVSRFAARALLEKKNLQIILDSMPDYDKEWIYKELLHRKDWNPEQSMGDLLEGLLPDKLAGVLIQKAGLAVSTKVKEVTAESIYQVSAIIKELPLQVQEVSGFEKAQVTSGGILLSELDEKTMEVSGHPGIYITGELLDVDGCCGGYNLQWAWATGYLAGRAAGRKQRENRCATR